MASIRNSDVTECYNSPRSAPIHGRLTHGQATARVPRQLITMGIIADTFRIRIEEMRRKDEESLAELNRILIKLQGIAKDMEQIDLESES